MKKLYKPRLTIE